MFKYMCCCHKRTKQQDELKCRLSKESHLFFTQSLNKTKWKKSWFIEEEEKFQFKNCLNNELNYLSIKRTSNSKDILS